MSIIDAATNTGILGSMGVGYSNSTTSVDQRRLIMGEEQRAVRDDTVFDARIRVRKVDNGYILEIATAPGQLYRTRIASTIDEVRDLILADMVAMKLEK